jgi:ubiquinone/menaquinone biosynthesis C-methylase UbiE
VSRRLRLDHFSLVAPIYDLVFGRMPDDRLRKLLELPAQGWLLDAGGGTGRVSHGLRDQVGGVVLIDLSPGMLGQASRKDGLVRTQAQVERLPFREGAFDRIIVVDALHHFGDQWAAAGELMRVLAPGGRLVIEEPNVDRWLIKLLALAERLTLMRSRFYPPEAMARMFRAHGGRVTSHTDHPINAWVVVDKPGATPNRLRSAAG